MHSPKVLRIGLLLVHGVVGTALAQQQAHPRGNASRGEYLTRIYSCQECHTIRQADGVHLNRTFLFAGGEPFPMDNGTLVHSANLTISAQYPSSLLNEIIRGYVSYKFVMPTSLFGGMAAEDMSDILAYLKTFPVQQHTLEDNRLAPGFVIPALDPPSPVPAHAPPQGTLEHGRYLSKMSICQECHSPQDAEGHYLPGQLFQGGGYQVVQANGSILVAPNITSAPKTGIGRWSDADIVRAVREGITPDGRQLDHIMPYAVAYQFMTKQDMADLIRFLRSLPPVERSWPTVSNQKKANH